MPALRPAARPAPFGVLREAVRPVRCPRASAPGDVAAVVPSVRYADGVAAFVAGVLLGVLPGEGVASSARPMSTNFATPRSSPRVVRVRALGTNTVEFAGADRAVYGAAQRVGARIMRSPRRNAWQVHEADADDVMAALERRGWRIDITL
jgi:hypothetical protein